eukprot:9977026-Alexandrium_andersonii.AAC.1
MEGWGAKLRSLTRGSVTLWVCRPMRVVRGRSCFSTRPLASEARRRAEVIGICNNTVAGDDEDVVD